MQIVASKLRNRKPLAIYKLYREVDSDKLRLAGAALHGHLKPAQKAGKVGFLARSHEQFHEAQNGAEEKAK